MRLSNWESRPLSQLQVFCFSFFSPLLLLLPATDTLHKTQNAHNTLLAVRREREKERT